MPRNLQCSTANMQKFSLALFFLKTSEQVTKQKKASQKTGFLDIVTHVILAVDQNVPSR